ncbi:hypothetical protein NGA_0693200 [Nannochloropsis gaditana CCMP526]|uniref:Uncharacterized protein n=1 Tax=Nannochloropsis gaditana TaxID=72520 RepID=W7TTX2_9STRA|nr:hypothetical protein NGA_0693200 [Nannochloropsis gaditana CCMP526]EKU23505.1 hypothetical protein NGA_0693200 [Nannochloropsis gaditana CCMP526]EWM26943.1 hypothetical protein Naga_101585g2 [Nannochloropsis gaditana]|eukprot:XP_005852380.1 hypothetical protein NGA_0693200 [Nannochloropsis gaditana CCMP526]
MKSQVPLSTFPSNRPIEKHTSHDSSLGISPMDSVRHPFESIAETINGAAVLLDAGAGEVSLAGQAV